MHWIGFLLDCRDKEDLRPDNASEPQQMRIYGPTFGLLLTSRQVFTNSSVNTTALGRWDEKAGLPRDAIRSQCSTCSRHKEKETGNAED